MNRYTQVLLRAYLPAAVLLFVAVGAMLWMSVAGSIYALRGWIGVLRWLPLIALLASLVMASMVTLRMWRWQRGDAATCTGCNGPLGRLQHGRSGDYRKCMACAALQDEQVNARQ